MPFFGFLSSVEVGFPFRFFYTLLRYLCLRLYFFRDDFLLSFICLPTSFSHLVRETFCLPILPWVSIFLFPQFSWSGEFSFVSTCQIIEYPFAPRSCIVHPVSPLFFPSLLFLFHSPFLVKNPFFRFNDSWGKNQYVGVLRVVFTVCPLRPLPY